MGYVRNSNNLGDKQIRAVASEVTLVADVTTSLRHPIDIRREAFGMGEGIFVF